jgi:hypothetical protein
MSILVGSLGPSYPSGVSPILRGGQDSTSAAAPSPQADSQRRQRKGTQAHTEKNRSTIRRRETLVSDIPVDGSLDILSGLVDFEQSVQSLDGNTSRNNQAPADFDANVLSDYESLFDIQAATASAPSTFPSIF